MQEGFYANIRSILGVLCKYSYSDPIYKVLCKYLKIIRLAVYARMGRPVAIRSNLVFPFLLLTITFLIPPFLVESHKLSPPLLAKPGSKDKTTLVGSGELTDGTPSCMMWEGTESN